MNYPQFNLTILQLPAPVSNMTKAEYKTAYGIDLDAVNIKAFKLVLLGEEKYAIDKIKEVENGYEIYFNGHVLSITDIVQTSDEVYDVENAKPIYCHPITIQGTNVGTFGVNMRVNFLIFNNSPTAFTLATFKTYLDNLLESTGFRAKILASGAMNKTKLTDASTAETDTLIISSIDKAENGSYAIMGYAVTVASIGNFADADFNKVFPSGLTFTDGVNKIN